SQRENFTRTSRGFWTTGSGTSHISEQTVHFSSGYLAFCPKTPVDRHPSILKT
ncbi:hypothetical protein ATANTOWER_003140, partial [Ataeniobius toweri]|nr:hypothetical protein [Ataeniobius toweri]